MTSIRLSLFIALGIALQVALYLGIVYWGHWRNYRALRDRAGEPDFPLTAAPGSPPEASAVAAWTGFRAFHVERKSIEDASQSVCSFYLVAEDGKTLPPFLPGQFLTLRLGLPGSRGGSEQITRCYSLSDAPRPDCYRISIKRVPAPIGSDFPPGRSSNHFHDQVEVGSRLQVRAPSGHFHIERSAAPVVLIGSGIGITPILSMVNWSLEQQPEREVWLFYGVRDGRDLMMTSHLHALAAAHPNFHLCLCFSAPQADDVVGRDYQHGGRIDVGLLRMLLPIKPYHFYICGPSAMLESLVPALEDWGVPDAHIHFEAFGPASFKRRPVASPTPSGETCDSGDSGIIVTFARSGKKLAWPTTCASLLEFSEASGVAVTSGCRAGACGGCQTAIVTGAVSYRQPPDFDPEPGTCLLCVCTPKTSLTLEA